MPAFITITGRLTRDPEAKEAKGKKLTKFSVAVDVYSGGEKKSEFYEVAVFGNRAEHAENWLSKGREVVVVGELTHRSYEATDGSTKWVNEVFASNFQPMGGVRGDQPAPAKDMFE